MERLVGLAGLLVPHPKSSHGGAEEMGAEEGDRQGHPGLTDRAQAVRYLFSAGRHNEHEDPHVVAAAAALGVSGGLRPSVAELKASRRPWRPRACCTGPR